MRQRSLAVKLIISITAIFVILFALFNGYTLWEKHSASIADTKEKAQLQAEKVVSQMENSLTITDVGVSNLTSNLQTLKKNKQLTYENIVSFTESFLRMHPYLVGAGVLFEANQMDALTGIPSELIDREGRIIIYATLVDDQLHIEPLSEYLTPGVSDWYLVPKAENRGMITNPYYYEVNGKKVLMSSLAQPIHLEGETFAGVVTADLSLNTLQKMVTESNVLKGYASLISQNGQYVANSFDRKLDMEKAKESFERKAIQTNKAESVLAASKLLGEDIVVATVPLKFVNFKEKWVFTVAAKKSDALADYYRDLILSIVVACVMMIVVVGMNMWLIRRALQPLTTLREAMESVAMGNLNTTLPESSFTEDEIGEVGYNFQAMVMSMKEVVGQIDQSSTQLTGSAAQLSTLSESMVSSGDEISSAIHEIARGASHQAEETEVTHQRTLDLSEQFDRVHQLTNEMTQLSGNVQATNDNGSEQVHALYQSSIQTAHIIQNLGNVMKELTANIKQIDSVIDYVNDISEQTNLLSLNASIEAARAGEHGKGFAVVANEVRKLAEQSKQSTAQIQAILSSIQSRTNEAETMMEQSVGISFTQQQSVEKTQEAFYDISAAVEQFISSLTAVQTEVQAMMGTKDNLYRTVETISAISQQTAAAAEEVSASASEQQFTIEHVGNEAVALRQAAATLSALIQHFQYRD